MGTINYSLSKRNARIALRNEDGTTVKVDGVIQYQTVPKWYPVAQMKEVMSTKGFMKYCVEHYGSVYGIVDLQACMEKISDCLIEQMLAGKKISLDEFGDFKAGISSEGVEDSTSFNPAVHIKKSYAAWTKPSAMNDLNIDAFNRVSTIALRNAALQADATGKSQAGYCNISLSALTIGSDNEPLAGACGGAVSGIGKYRVGDTATIQAIPAEGYEFVGWRMAGSTENISTSASYTITLNGNINYVAVFKAEE